MTTLHPKKRAAIQHQLLKWFDEHKRDLPWRATHHSDTHTRNPYHVWLAEIMLQQTQVATVIPYFQRWLHRFPTLQTLAAAPLDDVLKQWEGLGYYSRARNFHKAAQHVMNALDGEIPQTVEGLLKLPGIGRYTAGAIASLAFGQDEPILDGNVKRVFSRLFVLSDKPLAMSNELWELSEALLPKGRAGEFNEAVMDLGATICTPRAPNCQYCPLQTHCMAHAQGTPDAYPIKPAKKTTPHKNLGVLVLFNAQGQALLGQRQLDGLLGGLWEFVSGEISDEATLPLLGGSLASAVQRAVAQQTGLQVEVNETDFIGTVKHAFTHFKITKHVFGVRLATSPNVPANPASYLQLKWVKLDEIKNLALTRSDQKILAMLKTSQQSGFQALAGY